jgi:hypothetical protein
MRDFRATISASDPVASAIAGMSDRMAGSCDPGDGMEERTMGKMDLVEGPETRLPCRASLIHPRPVARQGAAVPENPAPARPRPAPVVGRLGDMGAAI